MKTIKDTAEALWLMREHLQAVRLDHWYFAMGVFFLQIHHENLQPILVCIDNPRRFTMVTGFSFDFAV